MGSFLRNLPGQRPGTVTAFGELLTGHNYPQFQVDFQYGVDTEYFETFTDTSPGTGSVSEANGQAVVSTGGGVGGYGVIRSKQFLQYKPGQGAMCRFTAVFTTPNSLSQQWVGLGSLENKLSIGYNGTDFSINRRTGGLAEIRTLTVTDSTGTGSTDVVLNGVTFNITLAAAASVAERAYDIATATTYTGWNAEAIGDTVVFQARSIGAKSSTYSYTGAGVATFAQTRGGAADVDNWVAQSSFNLDRLDGTGPSGIKIDPTKGNVFQIRYQWLGYGMIVYSCENSETGQFVDFHQITYANKNTTPSLLSPSMQMEIVSLSLGTSETMVVNCASMAAFIQGGDRHTVTKGKPHAADNDLSTSSTSVVPLLSIKPANVYNGKINFAEMHPALLSFATSSSGNKPGVFEVYRNATLTEPRWTYVSEGISHAVQDKSATGMTGGELIMAFSLPSSGSDTIPLKELNLDLNKADTITIGVRSVSGTIDFSASFSWEEDY